LLGSLDKVMAMLGAYHSSVALLAIAAAERQGIPYPRRGFGLIKLAEAVFI
jgi:hypothetical protein